MRQRDQWLIRIYRRELAQHGDHERAGATAVASCYPNLQSPQAIRNRWHSKRRQFDIAEILDGEQTP